MRGPFSFLLLRQGWVLRDKNVFIAECKIWEGKEKFLATIDQLLERYVCWRNTKVAILVFNRLKNFTRVVTEIRKNIGLHPLYERKDKDLDETTSRYVFRQAGDPDRKVVLTVMAFDNTKTVRFPIELSKCMKCAMSSMVLWT
jgi:hypothetical protein